MAWLARIISCNSKDNNLGKAGLDSKAAKEANGIKDTPRMAIQACYTFQILTNQQAKTTL